MNTELAAVFERIADLLEITGSDAFRVNSYRRVSRVIRDLTDDVRKIHEAGVLRELNGIGKATAEKIEEFINTGNIKLHEDLRKKVPDGLIELLKIQGLGPKKVALIYNELGVSSIDDLEAAVEDGRVEALPGMGKQSAARIIEGIAFLRTSKGRTPYGIAAPKVAELLELVRSIECVQQAEAAGSFRRGLETVGDIDLLCVCDDGAATVEAFVQRSQPVRVLASGDTKGSVTVALAGDREIQVDLRVVPAESFGAALQYFTGSKEHNVRIRERAAKRGWKLNEWGLFDGDDVIAGDTEAGIYAKLDLPHFPPETREDRFEFDDGFDPDALIRLDQLRGDLHTHTTASDGKNSIEQMADAAKALGYEYLVITDHSKSSVIANGLSVERLREHIAAIREADKKIKGIRLLSGTECDILPDGSLDYPDDVLAECDLVVASIHVAMEKGKKSPTERTLAAIANPYVTIIGHPTGRLIGRRKAMDIDMGAVVESAAANGTVIEINSSWQRLDANDVHARQALRAGAMLSIDTDAHSVTDLSRMHLGVMTAKRAGIPADRIVNTLPINDLLAIVERKRSMAD